MRLIKLILIIKFKKFTQSTHLEHRKDKLWTNCPKCVYRDIYRKHGQNMQLKDDAVYYCARESEHHKTIRRPEQIPFIG